MASIKTREIGKLGMLRSVIILMTNMTRLSGR